MFALETRLVRSSRSAASAVTSAEELTRNCVKAGVSAFSWSTSCVVVESAGLKYLKPALACAPLP